MYDQSSNKSICVSCVHRSSRRQLSFNLRRIDLQPSMHAVFIIKDRYYADTTDRYYADTTERYSAVSGTLHMHFTVICSTWVGRCNLSLSSRSGASREGSAQNSISVMGLSHHAVEKQINSSQLSHRSKLSHKNKL